MPIHLVNTINHRRHHHHHRSSQTSSSSNLLTHTEAAQQGGHIMSALDTVHWVVTYMTVAMVIEPHHAGPVPMGRKAAVAVAVDFTRT